ncbi:MAG TPA: hypothetical protein VJA47_06535 [archaeon]|nr:hypothetical protein [archaeon]
MDPIAEKDRRILEFIQIKHIASHSDLASLLGAATSESLAMQMRTIIDGGYVSIVRPLGQTSFTLTQKGIRFLNGVSKIV